MNDIGQAFTWNVASGDSKTIAFKLSQHRRRFDEQETVARLSGDCDCAGGFQARILVSDLPLLNEGVCCFKSVRNSRETSGR